MFYDKFAELCARRGVSCKRAVMDMGLSNSLATKWKNTNAVPNGVTLQKIADYFNVSMEYLVNDAADENKPAAISGEPIEFGSLSDTERRLVLWFRGLSAETQKAILDFGGSAVRTGASRDREER